MNFQRLHILGVALQTSYDILIRELYSTIVL
jgi:hypothetical protein